MLAEVNSNPFRLGDLIDAAGGAVRLDAEVDLVEAGEAMIAAAQDGMQTFTVPVDGVMIGDQSALELADGAERDPRLLPRHRAPAAVTESSVAAETTS